MREERRRTGRGHGALGLVVALASLAAACHGAARPSPSPSATPTPVFEVRALVRRTIPNSDCSKLPPGFLDHIEVRIYDPRGRLIGAGETGGTDLTSQDRHACLAIAVFLVGLPKEDYYVAKVPGQPDQRASPGDLSINGFEWALKG